MNICVYGAASNDIDEVYIKECEKLGKKIADSGYGYVFGGGAGGVMGAVARGAKEGGGVIVGIVPSFFNVDGVLFDSCTELMYTETMRIRKHNLEERSDAFIVAPGGIGTFDEFFEIFTLKNLGRHNKPIILFNVNGFYDDLIAMLEKKTELGFIKKDAMNKLFISDSIDEIFDYLKKELL